MKKMIALVCLGLAFTVSVPAVAAGEKMKGCSKEATGMKGDERKMFMKKCLSPAALSAQQDKMKACNAEARDKELKGADRKAFMSACLKG